MPLSPLHRTHSYYQSARLATIYRYTPLPASPTAAESDLHALLQFVLAENKRAMGPITSRLRRHTETMKLISYQYGHDTSAAIHRWASGMLLTLQQEMSLLEEVHLENLLALSFIDL